MNELQQKQLDLLKAFIDVCNKHNLRYYLLFGSVLGAIRHEGFIPWDDDVDVCMPRPDFEKLLKLQDEFSEPLFLQYTKREPAFTYTMAKLRDSNTTYLEKAFVNHNFNHGIYIDIFPLDGMSKRKNATRAKGPKSIILWLMWYLTYMGHFFRKPNWKKLHWALLGYIASIIFLPFNLFNWLAKLINAWSKAINYDEATVVGPYLQIYLNRHSFPRDYFGEGATLKFEGIDVKVPAKYHEYLSQVYGDYMKLPPLDKQKGHHTHYGCSTTISYKDYKF